jgi:hypothetical protein
MPALSEPTFVPSSEVIPTHGAVTSVFHLANSVRHTSQPDTAAWVSAASSRSSFLSAAIDHRPVAALLIEARLVLADGAISSHPRLRALSRQADRPTLIAIADLLLEIAPPIWLSIAVVGGEVRYEFIPSNDFAGIAWLQPELDQLLISAAHRTPKHSDTLALGLGRAAELTVLAALEHLQASPVHVAEISDRFGYDIETVRGHARRWEVKGCTTRSAESFHLSRNEFDQCRQYSDEWLLVQVEFAPEALTAESLSASHVSAIRELPTAMLLAIPPPESAQFFWDTSARIAPPASAWVPSSLTIPNDFHLPSIDTLGHKAAELRADLNLPRG